MKAETINKISKQIKNNKWIVFIFIIGLGLMLLPTEKSGEKKETELVMQEDYDEYKDKTEKDLKSIISQIKGAGRVDVMITVNDSGSTYFALDESESHTNRSEEQSSERQTQHVFKSKGSNTEEPLITTKKVPQISGVLICAQGAHDARVKNNIISAVEALLGVKSHRIEVLERK